MKVFGCSARLVAPILLLTCLSVSAAQSAQAQSASVSVSPADLSFGVPTGTPLSGSPLALRSAPQAITVNIAGTGTVTFSGASFNTPGNDSADFVVSGNSCVGTLTVPTTCQVSVTFTSTKPAGTLESSTLHISSNATPNTLTVPVNGASGSIELFSALNVNPSLFPGVTWPTSAGQAVQSTTITLSCPANVTATLSSTPDGLSNVFQDNTIQFAKTINTVTTTTTNVCTGGDPNFGGFTGFPAGTTNCFQAPYEGAAGGYLGQNPDLATFPNHDGAFGSFVANFGVAPLNVAGLLTPGGEGNQLQSVAVQMVDAGGDLGSATLHLVTSCQLAGVTPGGSITGNPITPGNTASQTQTFSFDNGGGQNISFTTSVSTAVQQGTVTVPSGTVPITTNIGIPQSLFSQLVAGTSSAPAVCLRLTGEKDSFGNPMCKGYLIQCKDPVSGTITGDNCIPTPSTARNIYDEAQFASPDGPVGTNFLGSACTFFLGNTGTCASSNPMGPNPTLIGPGFLMGSDKWLCSPGAVLTSCSNVEANTSTPPSPPVYTSANCSLTGSLAGNLCPLDTLTQFKGAADPSHGSTTDGRNSIFIPVVNMPLPFTQTTIQNQNANGWVSNSSVNVNFISNQASYNPTATNPVANNFTPAPPYSVTYGITAASSPVPDTTFPVANDQMNYNANTIKNFGAGHVPSSPICSIGGSTPTPNPFPSTANFVPGGIAPLYTGDGIYNLHYFTTDCAFSEELVFNPTGTQLTDPTANWASFRVAGFGVDTHAPTFAAAVPAIGTLIFNQVFTLNYECDDLPASAGIQTSGIHTCDSSLSNNVAATSPAGSAVSFGPSTFLGATPNLSNKLGTNQNITITAQDYAGNTTTSAQMYNVWYAGANVSCGPAASASPSRTFLAPVGADASATVKKGRSVPYKFRVCDANGVSIGASGPVISSVSVQMVGDNGGDTVEDIADAVEDTEFHWDSENQFWIYNLRTRDKERNVKYIYTLTLKDGTTLLFSLKVK